MKARIRRLLEKIGAALVKALSFSKGGRVIIEGAVDEIRAVTQELEVSGRRFTFCSPTPLIRWRNDTLESKEPETLRWIMGHDEGATLWDVGANIGLFSVFAAQLRNSRVVAFEPSVFNLELLARNIVLNDCADQVVIAPIALNSTSTTGMLDLSSSQWGGALSTFHHGITFTGEPIDATFSYRMTSMRLDDVPAVFGLPIPDYLKVDVDGIEHMVLAGGIEILSRVDSVLIEINDSFKSQADQCTSLLSSAGLTLQSKERSELMTTGRFSTLYNQIWVRK